MDVAGITGIVLMGGRSARMQKDKGTIDYHGMPQREYVYQMLQEVCPEVFYSCREDQMKELAAFRFKAIPDRFPDKGPMGALLSVFSYDPVSAKLVIATDLPYLDQSTIQFLIDSRDPDRVATAFRNPFDQKPDPLLTIWEPKSYTLLKQALAANRLSPRELLVHTDTNLIDPPDEQAIKSVDSIKEYQEALRHFQNNLNHDSPEPS